jgi:hypothetical protein
VRRGRNGVRKDTGQRAPWRRCAGDAAAPDAETSLASPSPTRALMAKPSARGHGDMCCSTFGQTAAPRPPTRDRHGPAPSGPYRSRCGSRTACRRQRRTTRQHEARRAMREALDMAHQRQVAMILGDGVPAHSFRRPRTSRAPRRRAVKSFCRQRWASSGVSAKMATPATTNV